MDDKNFDDLLKSKFQDYEYPELGAEAVAAFHNRAASFQTAPWYTRYRTLLYIAASGLLFTLLNGSIAWYGIHATENNLTKAKTETDHTEIDSLTSVIAQLKSLQQKPSVYIINPSGKQDATLQSDTHGEDNHNTWDNTSSSRHTDSKLYLGGVASLPVDILQRLNEEGVLETKDGEAYLLITDNLKQIRHKSYTVDLQSPLTALEDTAASDEPEVKVKMPVARLTNHISVKMINQLAEHQYTSGIGINLAPHLDLVKETFTQASGSLVPRIGLTAEWVVSPHWSFETSVDYLAAKFTTNKTYQTFEPPNVNTGLGTPMGAQINTRTVSTPINLKYRLWLTQKNQLMFKAGYTPYFYLRNQYVYNYPYPGSPTDSDLSINTVEEKDQSGYYGGTFTMSVGISQLIKKKTQFEAALFYEKSLGGIGPEKLNMQLFGIRTAYSIRVK